MENNIQQPLPPQQQTNQLHSVSPTTSYSPSKTFIILIVIIIITVVGIGGYMLGANQNQIVQNQIQPVTPTTQPSPTSTIGPTANWKTYTNEKWKYQFSYDPTWNLSELSPTQILLGGREKVAGDGVSPYINIYVWTKSSPSISLEEEAISRGGIPNMNCPDLPNTGACPPIPPNSINKKSTNNLKEFYYIVQVDYRKIAIIPIPNIADKYIEINYWSTEKSRDYFDQILSTFKFTDQNQTPNPPSYPSYTPDNPVIEEEGKLKVQNTPEVQTLIEKYGKSNVSIKALDVKLVKDIQFIMQLDPRFKEQTGCIIVVSSNNSGYVYQLDKNNEILYRQTLDVFKQKTAKVDQQILDKFYSSLM